MRIRLKKGVALFGTIAGAAIATALIVYNVNTGNGLNATDMDESGLFYELVTERMIRQLWLMRIPEMQPLRQV